MGTFTLGITITLGVVGLVLMCVTLVHLKRKGGFEHAMALTPDGKWPVGRYLMGAALSCLGLANFIYFFSR